MNPTLVALAGMMTDEGRLTYGLRVNRVTFTPVRGAGALSVTVHVSWNDPVAEALAQVKLLSCAELCPNMVTGKQQITSTAQRNVPVNLSGLKAVLSRCSRTELPPVSAQQVGDAPRLAAHTEVEGLGRGDKNEITT
jgi:hypothetical protein